MKNRVRRNIYKLIGIVGILFLILPGSITIVTAQSVRQVTADTPNVPTDQIILQYKNSSPAFLAPSQADQMGKLEAVTGLALNYLRNMSGNAIVIQLPSALPLDQAQKIADQMSSLPDVAYAVPDQRLFAVLSPNDPYYVAGHQWDLNDAVGGINAPAAWDVTNGSSSVVVADADTGLTNHADLAGRMVSGALATSGYDFVSNAIIANDGDGRDADPSDPGDWLSQTDINNNPTLFSGCPIGNSSWHGTHTAGTLGATTNNALGVAGINWNSKLLIVRVLGKCGGYDSDIIDGITWAAGLPVSGVPNNANPAKVINLSLGGTGSCTTAFQNAITAINNAGAVVVVASGNSNTNVSNFTPANCSGVIAVTSTGRTGSKAYYSNYGALVKISAPGGDTTVPNDPGILSTLNTGTTVPLADTYAYYMGTSMATPHVTGVVSLMFSVNPNLTPAQVLSILQSTARAFPSGSSCTTSICGSGIVNAAGAVRAAMPVGTFNKTSPVNGAANQPIAPTLSWGTANGASSYEYCVNTSNDGACDGTWVGTGTNTSANLSNLNPDTTYYWQVRYTVNGVSPQANSFAWWSFTTGSPPATFNKNAPNNAASTVPTNPSLSWSSSTGAASYEYCLDTTNNGICDTSWINANSNTSISLSGLSPVTTYYWQVKAFNSVSNTEADGGTWWSFNTQVSDCYTLNMNISPINGGTVGVDTAPNCYNGTMYTSGTEVNLTPTPASDYYRFTSWSDNASGTTVPLQVNLSSNVRVAANFDQAIFSDVPFDYSVTLGGTNYLLYPYIQSLYVAGYTDGCSTNPLSYCPNNTLMRVEAAVFMLRGLEGVNYTPPTDTSTYVFQDDWSSSLIGWGQPWAEGLYDAGLTAGCNTTPLLFCPASTFTRAEASVFGLRIKNGASYTPPSASHIFADDWSNSTTSWAEPWAEAAYQAGLLPACGASGGKPLFCPSDLVTRDWVAYLVVQAKGLPLAP